MASHASYYFADSLRVRLVPSFMIEIDWLVLKRRKVSLRKPSRILFDNKITI